MIRTTVIGNVTKDIVLKNDAQGRSYAGFHVASHRLYHGDDGVYPVDFMPVKVHGRLAELCAKHIGKGSLVAASGDQETYPSHDDPNRKEHVLVARAVQFLLPKKTDGDGTEPEYDAVDIVDLEQVPEVDSLAGQE